MTTGYDTAHAAAAQTAGAPYWQAIFTALTVGIVAVLAFDLCLGLAARIRFRREQAAGLIHPRNRVPAYRPCTDPRDYPEGHPGWKRLADAVRGDDVFNWQDTPEYGTDWSAWEQEVAR